MAAFVICYDYNRIGWYCYFFPFLDDHNRIVLNPIPGYDDCSGHFVNACHIDVSGVHIIIL